jgi:hypothetical protein
MIPLARGWGSLPYGGTTHTKKGFFGTVAYASRRKEHPMRWPAVFALGTLLLLPAIQAQAVPAAQTGVSITERTNAESQDASVSGAGAPVSGEIIGNLTPTYGFGRAAVGRLGTSAVIQTEADTNDHGQVQANAAYTVFDLVFFGPDAFVFTDMNALIDGTLTVGGSPGNAGAALEATIFLLPPGVPSGLFLGCRDIPQNSFCAAGFPFRLDLSNLDHAMITTPLFRVPTGVPITLEMELQSIVSSSSSVDGGGLAISTFSDTFSLPPTGPVFDLPAGFTVNSSQANIQDNRWLGADAPSAVPEPSTLTLLGLGVMAMAAFLFAESAPQEGANSLRA